jgi:hypothetical protein
MIKKTVPKTGTVIEVVRDMTEIELAAKAAMLAKQGTCYLAFNNQETMDLWRCRLAALA